MELLEMFADYCERAPEKISLENFIEIAKSNHILVDDGCFIVFAAVLGEIHILFPYASKGKSIMPIGRKLESMAKEAGFKKIKIITAREKAFARLFPDYSPVGTLYERELI